MIARCHMTAMASSIRTVAVFVVALSASAGWVWGAQPTITMSVGPDEVLNYPSNLPSLPDEHTTIFPPTPGSSAYRFFASSSLTGGFSGTVVLETTDLQTFAFAAGYADQVMSVPVHFTTCNPTYDSEFDENYAGPGSVVAGPDTSARQPDHDLRSRESLPGWRLAATLLRHGGICAIRGQREDMAATGQRRIWQRRSLSGPEARCS